MARVAFIQNLAYEYLGIMYLSAVLKEKQHEVDVFVEQGQGLNKLIKDIEKFKPDIAGFSCTTGGHKWGICAANLLKVKMPYLKIIFGGPHATFFPDVINEPSIDIICRGEGEGALLELSDRIDRGEDYVDIANLWVKKKGVIYKNEVRNLINQLDAVPFPDRELYFKKYDFAHKSQKTFITGRGCPFSCTYCFNHAFNKLYKNENNIVRRRSVGNVMIELKNVKNKYNFKTVFIQDDTFVLDKKWALQFLDEYRYKLLIPFICQLRADMVDEEIVRSLKNAGCLNVFFGVETGDEELRNKLLKKKISNEQIYAAAKLFKKYNIRFRTYNMFGIPGENLEDSFKTVFLNIQIKTDYPWSSLCNPFPRTELGEYVERLNINEKKYDQFEPSFFRTSNIKLKNKRELENMHKLFFYAVKFPALFVIVKWAIRKNPVFLYNLLFLFGYMWSF